MIEVWIALIGACVGSFLNVVILRVPRGESVVYPRSHCQCGRTLPWHEIIPVVSWVLLRGRCRGCGARIHLRYPLVELLTTLIFVILWIQYPPWVATALMLFAAMMTAAAFIDWDTLEIPDRFSVGAVLLGWLLSAAVPELHGYSGDIAFVDGLRSLTTSLQGTLVGSGGILWIAIFAEKILKKEAMGFGDVKLLGAIGAFCGWEGAIFALFAGSIIGILLLLPYSWTQMRGDSDTSEPSVLSTAQIPFGPSLVIASLLYLAFLHTYVDSYFEPFRNLFF